MRKIGRSVTVAGAALATTVAAGAVSWAAGLPGTANEHAGTATQQHSVTIPGPNANAGTHPDSTTNNSDQGKGSQVSQLATTTTLTGVQKGAAISTLASNGQSQAGQQHGSAASNSGLSKANTASGGASSAAANNASSHH